MLKLNKTVPISLIVIGAVALIALTIWAAIWISHAETRRAEAEFPKCQGVHKTHEVNIQNDKMNPRHTDAKRCDVLIITNLDEKPRIIAFGVHEKHVAYDGVTERYVSEKGSFKVRLIQPGTFLFHDHNQDEVAGTFTVSP